MSELRIGTLAEADREQVATVLQQSLNLPADHREERTARMPLEDFRCAYDGDRVVATAAAYRFLQWFGGRAQPMSGIFGVGTLPEYRGAGVMRDLVATVMRESLERGAALSALYPAVLGPYRSLGYELAGTYNEHRLPVAAIPAAVGDASGVREYRPEDLPAVRACHTRWARAGNGPVEPDGDEWWTARVMNPKRDETFRAVVVPGEGGDVEGFAAFSREGAPGHLEVAFGLDCDPFVATTERALRSLLAYFRGFRGLGQWVQWAGAPIEAATLLIPEQQLEPHWRFTWMERVLDVPRAFEARGWPAVDAEAVFAVEDELFPANAVTWRLQVRAGVAHVDEVFGTVPWKPLPIGVLSSMFTGYLRVHDAVRLGWLDAEDPAVGALEVLLAGADPWTGFFF